MEEAEFRVMQDGLKVAAVSGPREECIIEVDRYAAMYSQDGPVLIEQKVRGRWCRYLEIPHSPTPAKQYND